MIAIKPHHFIDIVAACGDGQRRFEPHPFGHAVHTVAHQILADPDVALVMELGADAICAPCRHKAAGLCIDTIDTSYRPAAPTSKREWNLIIDKRWCARLGLAQGDQLTVRRFCDRLATATDEIDSIYREEPADKTADRLRRLRSGVNFFLGELGSPPPQAD